MAWAAIAGASVSVNAGVDGGTTAAIDTTGADTIFVVMGQKSGGTSTLSDSKSNTWNALTTYVEASTQVTIYWSRPSSVGAGHTFTSTGVGFGPAICVGAFSGGAVNPFDTGKDNGNTGAASPVSTGSITPSVDNEIIIVGGSTQADVTGMDSGVTLLEHVAFGGFWSGAGLGYKIQTTAAAINVSVTYSGGADAAAIASFKIPTAVAPMMFLVF